MSREAEQRHIRWPELTAQQMVDLMTYMQHLPSGSKRAPSMRINDPAAGETLFDSKNCSKCHTLGRTEAGKVDLLRRAERFHTLVDFATAMWDHGPQMKQRSAKANIAFPAFQENEMSDLLAYLFDKHYFDEHGDAGRGARVYKARQCGTCHEKGEGGAPALAQFRGRVSPLFMTSALWRHGPRMLQETQKRGIHWPTFTGQEMSDLIAFLNR
jgi:mono/diheme cytochrome c family protein